MSDEMGRERYKVQVSFHPHLMEPQGETPAQIRQAQVPGSPDQTSDTAEMGVLVHVYEYMVNITYCTLHIAYCILCPYISYLGMSIFNGNLLFGFPW